MAILSISNLSKLAFRHKNTRRNRRHDREEILCYSLYDSLKKELNGIGWFIMNWWLSCDDYLTHHEHNGNILLLSRKGYPNDLYSQMMNHMISCKPSSVESLQDMMPNWPQSVLLDFIALLTGERLTSYNL